MATVTRILGRTVSNPRFDKRVKRGLLSIRDFQAGLPFNINTHSGDGDFFGWGVSIDIPLLKIRGLAEGDLVRRLLDAATAPAASPLSCAAAARTLQVPKGEFLRPCATCGKNAWVLAMHAGTDVPARAMCARCGGTLRFVRTFHPVGHA